MPGHIYARVGDYEGAAHRNVVAADVDHAYIEKNAVKGVYPLMYYTHNLHFLTWANMMAGNYAGAKKAAERTVANVKSSVKEMPMVEFFFPTPTFVALRFQKWDEILRSPLPDRELPTDHALAHFARGVAAAATGDMKTVDEERKAFAAARKKVPQDAMWSLNPAAAVLDVAEYVLEGRALDAKGDPKAAIEAWEKAVAAQESLAYDEPPDWYYPVRESLGASLLRGGQAKEAEKVFREDLQRNPRNPRSLFGLWQSLLAQKKTADVDWVKAAFDTAWKNADTKLRLEDL
jgi:tetratricopeptide (TPR) repeat protein